VYLETHISIKYEYKNTISETNILPPAPLCFVEWKQKQKWDYLLDVASLPPEQSHEQLQN